MDIVVPGRLDEMVLVSAKRDRTVTRQVVVKEDDLLSPSDVKDQFPEVQKAMLKEFNTWADLKCFSRRPRRDARNIIDVRWVHTRKWEKPKFHGEECTGGTTSGEAQGHWASRSRLALGGFKDAQKDDIARYAGTSTRAGQTAPEPEAVRHGWPIRTLDISVAFLT